MKISPYNIIIQHRSGASNTNGDFMARYPLPDTPPHCSEVNPIDSDLNVLEGTTLLDHIRSQQRNDPLLARIIHTLKENSSVPFGDQHASYILINDLLYKVRHKNSYTNQRLLDHKHLLVVPSSLQRDILR